MKGTLQRWCNRAWQIECGFLDTIRNWSNTLPWNKKDKAVSAVEYCDPQYQTLVTNSAKWELHSSFCQFSALHHCLLSQWNDFQQQPSLNEFAADKRLNNKLWKIQIVEPWVKTLLQTLWQVDSSGSTPIMNRSIHVHPYICFLYGQKMLEYYLGWLALSEQMFGNKAARKSLMHQDALHVMLLQMLMKSHLSIFKGWICPLLTLSYIFRFLNFNN